MARIIDPLPMGPTDLEEIAAFEQYIGYPLPSEYRDFLIRYNGGHPKPDAFLLNTDLGEQEDIVFCLFPVRNPSIGHVASRGLEGLRAWPLHCAWDDLQSDLEKLYAEAGIEEPLLPIGTDGSGNYFCIVLDGFRAKSVIFLDHETGELFPLADHFNGFLDSLRPRQREDYTFD